MIPGMKVPAAEYLRMSTEHQQYSVENQRAAIREYAEHNGLELVKAYVDEGKSGLLLRRRDALQQLLGDVLSGRAEYKVILAYDVSRWGRFQDADEAAHYEFLCREAGVQVHYCAEPFTNDRALTNALMKTVKRVMAGEYSRELSSKVHEGSKRIAELGFRTGGEPGYGLRRMLISSCRDPKQLLLKGERKSLQSDRVILAPGPENEVACVRQIFRMFADERKWPKAIAAELRKQGVPYPGLKRTDWYAQAVDRILKNPKYCGSSVFGRTSFRLHTRRTNNPRALWTVTERAWPAVIDKATFDKAESLFYDQTIHRSDSELLAGLRRLLEKQGALSEKLISSSPELASASRYVRRFGSLSEAFAEVGYLSWRLAATQTRRNMRVLRDRLLQQIISTSPVRITLFQPDKHLRPRLRVFGLLISLYLCRCLSRRDGSLRWLISPIRNEQDCLALIVRLSPGNECVEDMFVVPDTRGTIRFQLRSRDPWLLRGKGLRAIEEFTRCVEYISGRRDQ
jgi:DNA invertase Pin-like site-specific DNA recombinase